MTSSGRPFELIDVRVVGEDGADVAKDSQQVCCRQQVCMQPGGAVVLCSSNPAASHTPCPLQRDGVMGLQVGEVWVRGPTVFGGYWGLPEATAEAFAEDGWFK